MPRTLYKEKVHELNEQVGHQLAVRTREQSTANFIKTVRDPEVGLKTDSEAIRQAFKKYYHVLYNDADIPQDLIHEYINQDNYTRLESSEADVIPQWEEIALALNSLAVGKAAGMDGIPSEFYVKFASQVKDILALFVHIFQGGRPPRSRSMAKIIVFLKYKDTTELGSYRPITLITCDSKIYAKLLAARLAPNIHKIVSVRQHGFIPKGLLPIIFRG